MGSIPGRALQTATKETDLDPEYDIEVVICTNNWMNHLELIYTYVYCV